MVGGGAPRGVADGTGPPATARAGGPVPGPDERRPGVPGRLAAALLFAATVLGGALGAGIGWGLVDVGCRGDCTLALAVGTLVGGTIGATGVGVVAVLVLRAMNEWRLPHAAARGGAGAYPLIARAGTPPPPPGPGTPIVGTSHPGTGIPDDYHSPPDVDVEADVEVEGSSQGWEPPTESGPDADPPADGGRTRPGR